jgi:hypothetical protein
MTTENYKTAFMNAATDWICDSYTVTVRYIVIKQDGLSHLVNASIALNPLPTDESLAFEINTAGIIVGNYERNGQSKEQIFALLESAVQGIIEVNGKRYVLSPEQKVDFYSDMSVRDRWFYDLHLQVSGERSLVLFNVNLIDIDNQLRRSDPPFDGLSDIANWLGLPTPVSLNSAPTIQIRIAPPVDVIFEDSRIINNELLVVLHAHPKFNQEKVGLSIRGVPGSSLAMRRQATAYIHWEECGDDRRQGNVRISFKELDSALVMLSFGETTVRRQWFLDAGKAPNRRFVAMQMFDKDLRMVRMALEQQDSVRFEKGVAALLFLLGFASAIQLETDSPDIILTTPGGKLALVECTTRVADFATKIGKLVDRRRALLKSFESSSQSVQVYGILACGLPRDQIAFRAVELEEHKLILITRDELSRAFNRLRFPNDPDEILAAASAKPV